MGKKKKEYYKDSGVVLDTSGNQIGTYKVPTAEERETIANTGRLNPVSVQPTLTMAQINLQKANDDFNLASQNYQNRLSQEIAKTGYNYTPQTAFKPLNQISYQTKNEDLPKSQQETYSDCHSDQ